MSELPWGPWPPSPSSGTPGPPGPPGSESAQPTFVWRPGGVASATVLTTWAQVEAAILANLGSLIILVDISIAPAIVPNTADTECYGRVDFAAFTYDLGAFASIEVQDGGRLRNPHTFTSVQIHGAPTIRPFILCDKAGGGMFLQRGPVLALDGGATVSAVEISAPFFLIAQFEGGSFQSLGSGPTLIDVAAGTTVLHSVVAQAGAGSGSAYPADTYGGGAGGALLLLTDASAPLEPQTSFVGSVTYAPYDKATGALYNDALVAPPLGATDVQGAIDALKVRGPVLPYTATAYATDFAAEIGRTNRYDVTVSLTATLPAAPADNDVVAFQPVATGAGTTLTIDGSGKTIVGSGTGSTLIVPSAYPLVLAFQFSTAIDGWFIVVLDLIAMLLVNVPRSVPISTIAGDIGAAILTDNTVLGSADGNDPGPVANSRVCAGVQTLVSDPSIVFPTDVARNAIVTLSQVGHSLTFAGVAPGASGQLVVAQDGAGGQTIATWVAAVFPGGVAPVLSVTPNAVDLIAWFSDDGVRVFVTVVGSNYS